MLAHSLLCAKQITLAVPKLGMQHGFTELYPIYIELMHPNCRLGLDNLLL